MRVCFVGLGSIGKRHIKNLKVVANELGVDLEIDALRTSNTLLPPDVASLISKSFNSIEALKDKYDVVFITNPTSKHYDTLKSFIGRTKNVFIEKPLFSSTKYNWQDIAWHPKGTYHVASPLRWNPVIQYLKLHIAEIEPVSLRCICSSYLPDWRKDQDYRKVYSAAKEMGGGVSLDLIHEWDSLVWLFGFPEALSYMHGKFSSLQISSDDLSVYLAKYRDFLCEIHLDYFGRETQRKLEIFTNNDVIHCDILNNTINSLNSANLAFGKTDIYLLEMKDFLERCLNGEPGFNTPENAWRELLLSAGTI